MITRGGDNLLFSGGGLFAVKERGDSSLWFL